MTESTPSANGAAGLPGRAADAASGMPPTAGAMLRAARLRQGLQLGALAGIVKVSPAKLEALEADHYDALPDATFTRALAKTLCRVLKIDAAGVLALLPAGGAQSQLEWSETTLNTPFRERQRVADPMEWTPWRRPVVWAVALLLAAAAAFVLVPVNPGSSAALTGAASAPADAVAASAPLAAASDSLVPEPALPPGAEAAASAPGAVVATGLPAAATTATTATAGALPAGAGSAPSSTVGSLPVATNAAMAATKAASTALSAASASAPRAGASGAMGVAPAAVLAQAASGAAKAASAGATVASAPALPNVYIAPGAERAERAVMRAVQDTWVQATDANGKVLGGRLFQAGETVQFAGALPLKLRIGNVAGTELSFRGQPVDIRTPAQGNVITVTLR